jgi:outer membrane immunogenic protein
MRRFAVLLAALSFSGSAFAADMAVKMPTKAPPPVVASAYSWTGFYIGINGGGGYGQNVPVVSTETDDGALFTSGTWPGFGNFGTLHPAGGFGGGQIGYNWQTGPYVLGLEADFQGSHISASQAATLPYIDAADTVTVGLSTNLEWFGTIRGRVGYAWDRLLLFATGGFAYGEVRTAYTYTDTFGFSGSSNTSSTRSGYTVGAGGEYAFAPKWSAKFEYQYVNLGSTTVNLTEGSSTFADSAPVNFRYQTFRLGLNYHF